MSQFIISSQGSIPDNAELPILERIHLFNNQTLTILGTQRTYHIVRDGDNFICALGYACACDLPSMNATLHRLLSEVKDYNISEIKKNISGQFILIIKKGQQLFLLTDFVGGRNIFYNPEQNLIASSFALAENSAGFNSSNLDTYKTVEFLATREILYPCWLNRQTMNKKINWLLPYEYIKIEDGDSLFEIRPIIYHINNHKQKDSSLLSEKLLRNLESVLYKEEFKNSTVCCSLTGGRDSRLIATIAAKYYPNCQYRIAISSLNKNSLKDLKVARKIAEINKKALNIYELNLPEHENIYIRTTEGFSPTFNITVTPIIINAEKYALGLGGAYGSELFAPIPYNCMQDFCRNINLRAQSAIKADDAFWNQLNASLEEQLKELREHYMFQHEDERDYVRLFQLLMTARYNSFINSAINQFGYQLEPFGTFPVIETGLQISPEYWGNKRSIIGDALIEKEAFYRISPKAARVLAYSSYRPVMPFSFWSSPLYMGGYVLNILNWLSKKITPGNIKEQKQILPGIYYKSDGWEKYYTERLSKYT
jgi:hypothetical protein